MAKRTKSALKANRQNIKRREHNRTMRSKLRTALKSIRASLDAKDLTGGEGGAQPDCVPGRQDGDQGNDSQQHGWALQVAAGGPASESLCVEARLSWPERSRRQTRLGGERQARLLSHNSTTNRSIRIRGSPPEDLSAISVLKTASTAGLTRRAGSRCAAILNWPRMKNGTMPASSERPTSRSASRTSFRWIALAIPKSACASGPAATACFTSSGVIVGCPIA